MDTHDSQPLSHDIPADRSQESRQLSRRKLLKLGALGLTASTLGILEANAWLPVRLAHAAPASLPDIQFDIVNYLPPAQTLRGVQFRFGPVHTVFLTAKLKRAPTKTDQQHLANALNTIEATYPFRSTGRWTIRRLRMPQSKDVGPQLPHCTIRRLICSTSPTL